jgi:S-formylglutathione hydrolase FrmB
LTQINSFFFEKRQKTAVSAKVPDGLPLSQTLRFCGSFFKKERVLVQTLRKTVQRLPGRSLPVQFFLSSLCGLLLAAALGEVAQAAPSFILSFPKAASAAPLDGRLILLLAADASSEPRLQVDADAPLKSPYIFGVDVGALQPGQAVALTQAAFGWPAASLASVKPGDYMVQAVLNRYEVFHRADGSMVTLPPDQGEGQNWAIKPGNLYSKPVRVHVDPASPEKFAILLDQKIPPIAPKTDTSFVRHITLRSALLSKFWGRPVFLGAHVLLPEGFDAHPDAHYPLMVFHGHFPDDISGFRTTPPDPALKPDYAERFHLAGYNRIQQQEAYDFYRKWISPGFPRFLVIEIEHANPYYDDSYAVNSANLGPYGDAINHELIPAIEKQFRGLGQGWARFTYGGSTGGWEALATQVFYPDMYNGAFAACPDPIDFRAYTVINLYKDKNAYTLHGQTHDVERPAIRDYLGEVFATQRDANGMERALGDHGRSTGQYDIWQAVYGPEGKDGYPAPIFDKITGVIDPAIAAYWREHYDLTHIIQRDWARLGPLLEGKIHIYVGSADTFYLNDAVYFAQATLEALRNPAYGGEVAYGDRAEHCWNGDPKLPNAYSRLHYNFMYLPKILERIAKTAPQGADLKSWRY